MRARIVNAAEVGGHAKEREEIACKRSIPPIGIRTTVEVG